ncbi:MAG: N-acetyl-gamma-glutamyl-phosphate reductase [Fidelibacterota bacterium]|nr:MAG: N-acetyl-gamma-glutamyl-phosphate reductase [Candidatus Neomarinimicrobiota bacterium]
MPELTLVSIVGGAGYVGGELLRLVLFHPHLRLSQVTSRRLAGKYIGMTHPNLRGVTAIQFAQPEDLAACDVLFLCLDHGESARSIERFSGLSPRIIDCSSDFRLRDAGVYEKWYQEEHPAPEWLGKFVYGLPELYREELTNAAYVSGVGCNATVVNLALAPLARSGMLKQVVADVKVGSSEGGAKHNAGSHHPERSGAVRSYKPTGHRHQAEVRQVLGNGFELSFSVTSVEMVRGALVTAHCFLKEVMEERAVWELYREAYGKEPFVRLVKQRTGIHRYPEPKHLAGSNYCDIGFEVDATRSLNHVVMIAALDNLVKGAAGSAIQSLNVMMGWDEMAGLRFPGLHPV